MKVTCNRVGGLLILSDTTVKFGRIDVSKYEGGIFRANKRFAFDTASPGNIGFIAVAFGIGIYAIIRGDES